MYEKSVELAEEDFYCGDYIYLAESIANEESLATRVGQRKFMKKQKALQKVILTISHYLNL